MEGITRTVGASDAPTLRMLIGIVLFARRMLVRQQVDVREGDDILRLGRSTTIGELVDGG